MPLDEFEDYEGDTPITLVDNSWQLSSNFPGSKVIWSESTGRLFFPDFNSTNATANTNYQVNLTIADSVGVTREISFNFIVAANVTTNSTTTSKTSTTED